MIKKIFTGLMILMMSMFTVTSACAMKVSSGNPHWSKSNLKVYTQVTTKHNMVKKAFSEWENASYNRLSFTFVNNPDDADIIVKYNSGKILASHSTVVEGSNISKGYLNVSLNKNTNSKYSEKLATLMVEKEIGYILGLKTNDTMSNSIMKANTDENVRIRHKDMERLYRLNGWNWAKKRVEYKNGLF